MTHPINQTKVWSAVTNTQLEAALLEFDENWTPHRFEETAAQWSDAAPADRKTALSEIVKIDLERHWQKGERRLLEFYLARYPDLGTPETVAVELIFAEYEIRLQFQQPAKFAAFVERFPSQAAALKRIIQEARQSSGGGSVIQTGETLKPIKTDVSTMDDIKTTTALTQTTSLAKTELPNVIRERYEIHEQLGMGAMGRVLLAHDTQLDRKVALKIPVIFGEHAEETRKRFLREAKSAAQLNHPNICTVFDCDVIDDFMYITMEYVEGSQTLDDWTQKHPAMSERSALLMVRKIAQGLDHAHEHQIIHRDIKPDNILVDRKSNPHIADFGLVLQLGEESRETQSGTVMGTPAYMPPEQIQGELNRIGPLVDVYALGVVLYEMLAGHLPFGGTVHAVFTQVLTQEPPNPLTLRPDLDPELAAYCLRMMAKKPEDRPQSMAEVAKTLHRLYKKSKPTSSPNLQIEESPSSLKQTHRTSIHKTQPTGASASVLQVADSPPKPPKGKRRTWLAGAGGLFLCLGIIITMEIKGCKDDPLTSKWFSLFNSEHLTKKGEGWYLESENDELVGDFSAGTKANPYLISAEFYSNFEFTLKYRFESEGRIGIHFRSEVTPEGLLSGPKVDLGTFETGSVTGRLSETGQSEPTVHNPALSLQADANAKDGWNILHIEAFEDWVSISVNGIETSKYHHPLFAREGIIGFELPQNSAGVKVRFAEMTINELPSLQEEMAKPGVQPKSIGYNRKIWSASREVVTAKADLLHQVDSDLFFGDPKWRNYDLHVEVSVQQFAGNFAVLFLSSGQSDFWSLRFGPNPENVSLRSNVNGNENQIELAKSLVSRGANKWVNLDVEIRGSSVKVKLNNKLEFTGENLNLQFGRIGCRVTGIDRSSKKWSLIAKRDQQSPKWRNIEVRHESGKLLWKGAPSLP